MLRFIVLVTVLASPVWSYSSGAPDMICTNNLTPEHGQPLQTGAAPYTLASAASVKSGQLLELTLSGDEFLGFAIQGRTSNNKPIGTFKDDGQLSQVVLCSGVGNTLTHRKLKAPIKSLKVTWQAPQSYQGPVTFHATVVKDGKTYWVGKVKNEVVVKDA